MNKFLLLALFSVSVFANVQCIMCHNGSYQVNLAKYTPQEIEKMMLEYKKGEKIGDMMSSIARKMSVKEIKETSEKFGKH